MRAGFRGNIGDISGQQIVMNCHTEGPTAPCAPSSSAWRACSSRSPRQPGRARRARRPSAAAASSPATSQRAGCTRAARGRPRAGTRPAAREDGRSAWRPPNEVSNMGEETFGSRWQLGTLGRQQLHMQFILRGK